MAREVVYSPCRSCRWLTLLYRSVLAVQSTTTLSTCTDMPVLVRAGRLGGSLPGDYGVCFVETLDRFMTSRR